MRADPTSRQQSPPLIAPATCNRRRCCGTCWTRPSSPFNARPTIRQPQPRPSARSSGGTQNTSPRLESARSKSSKSRIATSDRCPEARRAADPCDPGGHFARLVAARRRSADERRRTTAQQGITADADSAAAVYLHARHHAVPKILPLVHPDDDIRKWLYGVPPLQEAWLMFADDGTVLGHDGDWPGQYVHLGWAGRRLGTRL